MPLELNEIELKKKLPELIKLINQVKENDSEKLVKELKKQFLEKTGLNINIIKYIDSYKNKEEDINMINFEIFGVYDITVKGEKIMDKRRSI